MPTRDMPFPAGTPCWIDVMTSDPETARSFYGELFGWKFAIGDASTGFYSMASLDDREVAGVGQWQIDHPSVWTTYLATADCDATGEAITRAGGTVAQPPMDVLTFGRMAVAQDSSGGTFGLWQAGTHNGTAIYNEPNSLTWNELLTRDYEGAKRFYAEVFGYTYTDIGGDQFDYATIEVDGVTVGGLGALPTNVPADVPAHWLCYFQVDDVDATVERAVALGGAVQRPAADMPYGRHAGLADPTGAGFAVITPAPRS
jgi:uncharacterized protein